MVGSPSSTEGSPMPKVSSVFSRLIERFIHTQSSSSILLAVSTLIAMVIANSSFSPHYFQLLEIKIFSLSNHHWINDGLMAVFFFVIGMEIKREIVVGELSSIRKAALPVFAAFGGMIAPAAIYFWINPAGEPSRGWAIPMATDIAFALGVLTLFGKRVPLALKVFLLALSIVDDLGAVLVIATVYTSEIKALGLLIAMGAAAALLLARSLRVRSYLAYIPIGVALWFGVLFSGVHATVAGVIIGLLTPFSFSSGAAKLNDFSPLNELIHTLHPWVSFAIMPIFALANAGIPLSGISASVFFDNSVSMGVMLGLFLGKPLGIMSACLLAVALGFATLPSGLKWRHLLGVSFLAGIGFTMSIFIANLALIPEHSIDAKVAILAASILSAMIGYFLLAVTLKREIMGVSGA